MSKAKGTVKLVGKGKFSSFVMLEDRDGFYFNTKFDPKCGIGDVVGIEFEQKGDTRGNIKRLVVITDNGAPKGVQESAAPSGGGGAGRGADQRPSIVWQHSQEMAILFVSTLVSSESIKLPAAAKREDFLLGLVDSYTEDFNAEALAAKLLSGDDEPVAETPAGPQDEWSTDDKPTDDEWSKDDEWKD